MSQLKRPGRGETEEDLLKFQQEFLKSKEQLKKGDNPVPSTSLENIDADTRTGDKRKCKDNNTGSNKSENALPSKVPTYETTRPKSRFKAGREPLYEVPGPGDADILTDKDVQVSTFLTQIVERDTRNVAITAPTYSTDAFPVVQRRDPRLKKDISGQKLSIFAQQFEESKQNLDIEMRDGRKTVIREVGIQSSSVVKGSGLSVSFAEKEVKQIHEENTAKLSQMTSAEILEEQRKLMENIDPQILAYLKRNPQVKRDTATQMDTSSNVSSLSKLKEKKPEKDDITLPFKREEDWLGMDNIEYDKLEWMKELQPIKTEDGTGIQARFDLNGNFVSAEANVPLHEGLHHHGEEPERAGYTLEELFHLSRSSNIPQRILALNVLAKIITKAKQGLYVDFIQTCLIPTMLDAGVIFLFRWALDDSSQSVQMAAINTLYSLLCNEVDEYALDNIYYWYQGLVQSSLIGPPSEEGDKDEEKPQETDDDMAKRDLIQALVSRMMLLPRLKYLIMEKMLSAPTIVQILLLLTRIAQHSQSLAYEIVHFPGLLKYIFSEFLPATWPSLGDETQINTVRGYPLPEAMKLIATICKAGKNMTLLMISSYSLQDVIQRYITVTTRDLELPEMLGIKLQKQSYIAWKICLSYGFTDELYLNLYSVFMKNLQSIQQNVLNNTTNQNGAMLISSLESVLHVASIPVKQSHFNVQEEDMDTDNNDDDNKVNYLIDWSNIVGVYQPILQSFTHQLHYIGDNYHYQKIDLEMITCFTNFLASFYDKVDSQIGYNAVETLQSIEKLCHDVLLPFWKSLGFRSILINISHYSNLLSESLKHEETSSRLPSYGASCLINGISVPILHQMSSIGFLTAYLRLTSALCRLHKGIIDVIVPCIINDEDIISYMRRICQLKDSVLYSNYFTKFENIFQYQILILSTFMDGKEMNLLHHCALKLLTRLQHGDEYIIHHLLSYIVFSPQYLNEIRSSDETLQSMADLQLTDVKRLKSATQEEIILTSNKLLETARNDLLSGSIRMVYLTVFSGKEKQCAKSRGRYKNNPVSIDTMLTGNVGETLLPQDWMFLPLVELYNKSALAGSHYQDHMPVQNIRMVSSVLEWIFLLEHERPEILKPVSVSLKLSRIMCVFLAGNDLFLETSIRSYLAALLREYTKPVLLQQLDLTRPIPGLISFFDLYQALLEQYGAVSFGDSVFGSYVLIPLQQIHPVSLRLSIWGDRHDCLRALMISVQELLLPMERYLEPDETDTELIQLYFVHLTSQLIQPIRTPVPYLIAVHHTNRFLYYTQDTQNTSVRAKMWQWVKAIKIDVLKNHLIYYKQLNMDCEYCMELYTTLPSNRQQTFTQFSS